MLLERHVVVVEALEYPASTLLPPCLGPSPALQDLRRLLATANASLTTLRSEAKSRGQALEAERAAKQAAEAQAAEFKASWLSVAKEVASLRGQLAAAGQEQERAVDGARQEAERAGQQLKLVERELAATKRQVGGRAGGGVQKCFCKAA